MEIKRAVTNKRALMLLVCFLVIFAVLGGRIAYIQAAKEVKGQDLSAIAEQRWQKSHVIEGKRGTIYDRSGDAVAEQLQSYSVYAVLSNDQNSYVRDPAETAEELAPLINLEPSELQSMLEQDKFQVELGSGARNLSYEKMTEIKEKELDGIHFTKQPRRYYPKQMYASHVIGYTERDMAVARMGLERSLDELLSPEDGSVQYDSDHEGVPLPNPNNNITPAVDGDDVYLTLDSNVQVALEQVMSQVADEYSPKKMTAIVADPKTGAILAMSNRPSFNPNEYESVENYTNYAISDRFEPGSTMKMFTVAAAIEEGVWNAEDTYQSGSYKVDSESTISDHRRGGWGTISFREGFLRSSNVAMMILGLEKLGPDKLYDYWDKFGFFDKTGIDLPNETDSQIAQNGRSDAATTSFGQGSAVTPIQIIQAATAIANDGVMMKPYVIDRITEHDTGELIEQNEPTEVGQPISEETAAEVRKLLGQVVSEEEGTGNAYQIAGFDIAGKTGTAQVLNEDGPGYMTGHGNNLFSFMGMAPEDDPKVMVYVAVERPQLDELEVGSEPVALIFNTIMQRSLDYLNIAPTIEEVKEETESGYKMEDLNGQTRDEAVTELENYGMEVLTLGEGNQVESQQPEAGVGLLEGEKVVLYMGGGSAQLPDMTGWSARDVLKVAAVFGVNLEQEGNGFLIHQSPGAGEVVQEGDTIQTEFSSEEDLSPEEDNPEEANQDDLNLDVETDRDISN
ncbi:penicillin-binding protein [Alkalicoccobacillus murimartini]|uniref:serine-type D-Ala-D-Ala carboxypeptidase n=1 Tax=Alkalicoccobacillus murimartini TaxID=171685 RepID=A0ABT9YF46_9BACI|nr:penicillin-binding protein [Alkalicoccobacillus murimartini]MDQ0206450.1 penicillin-binding protein 2B [Alkalicoccobacillus murimartini]